MPRSAAAIVTPAEVEADEHALGVRQVADDLPHRFGQAPLERRDGDDLLATRQLWPLEEIDDLDAVLPGQMLLADPPEIGEGGNRPWGLAGHVQPQLPNLVVARRR